MTSDYFGFQPRLATILPARQPIHEWPAFAAHFPKLRNAGMAAPFTGITVNGRVRTNLFQLAPSEISAEPMRDAARALLGALTLEQRNAAIHPIDSDLWRAWSNIHPFLLRHGVLMETMTPRQLYFIHALLRTGLSPHGFESARNVMRLNETIAEITQRPEEYGEGAYWFTVFGYPSAVDPWGWQLDGHHLAVNCLVLGDQVAMTPQFFGSEPVVAQTGRYAGVQVLQEEQERGAQLMESLSSAQRDRAVVGPRVPRDVWAGQFNDNVEIPFQGVACPELTTHQQQLLRHIVETYVGRMASGYAADKMHEVDRYLPETYFAWMGEPDPHGVFYYRIQSPVLLIEFDHLPGIAFDNDAPTRNHIHTILRTPNGNDYGMDLLRQHYARHHAP